HRVQHAHRGNLECRPGYELGAVFTTGRPDNVRCEVSATNLCRIDVLYRIWDSGLSCQTIAVLQRVACANRCCKVRAKYFRAVHRASEAIAAVRRFVFRDGCWPHISVRTSLARFLPFDAGGILRLNWCGLHRGALCDAVAEGARGVGEHKWHR